MAFCSVPVDKRLNIYAPKLLNYLIFIILNQSFLYLHNLLGLKRLHCVQVLGVHLRLASASRGLWHLQRVKGFPTVQFCLREQQPILFSVFPCFTHTARMYFSNRFALPLWDDRTPQIKCKVSLLRSWSKIGAYQS